MEGLYFEVKPRRDDPSRSRSFEKTHPHITSNSRSCPSLLHLTSSTLSPNKVISATKSVALQREREEEEEGEEEEEVRYKLALIGSQPVHYLTTMAMLPWVVAEISRTSEKELSAGLQSGSTRGGQQDPSTHSLIVCLCVSASWVRCESVFGDGVVWDPLTHTVLFECRPHQVTKLIHNSQEPSSFACLVRDSFNCACYVFRCQDSTKVSVCVFVCKLDNMKINTCLKQKWIRFTQN